MATIAFRKLSVVQQYFYSFLLIIAVSSISFAFSGYSGYHVPALLLLLTVSIIAMFCDIVPVIVAAIVSALIWNFYFIPPLYTFHIGKSEDILMFLMYFVIALLNAVLTIQIRRMEKQALKKEEQENFIKTYNLLLDSLATELNEPIAAIIQSAVELRRDLNSIDKSENPVTIDDILTTSRNLDRKVGNIITMSRLESGTIEVKPEWCNINDIIHEVVKVYYGSKILQRFEIQVPDALPSIFLDKGLIEQILQNLIHNSLNYSPGNSLISLEATLIIDQLVITIENDGAGFPEDQIKNVFNQSYRIDANKPRGIGLGLFVIKGIIEECNGSIVMKNRNEGGALFSFSLPVKTSYIKNQAIPD
jgi:two-component system, OmpR family, sensor histidine kinase KdpD